MRFRTWFCCRRSRREWDAGGPSRGAAAGATRVPDDKRRRTAVPSTALPEARSTIRCGSRRLPARVSTPARGVRDPQRAGAACVRRAFVARVAQPNDAPTDAMHACFARHLRRTNSAWASCPHRLACLSCPMSVPDAGARAGQRQTVALDLHRQCARQLRRGSIPSERETIHGD
jgi:hypothetical protein